MSSTEDEINIPSTKTTPVSSPRSTSPTSPETPITITVRPRKRRRIISDCDLDNSPKGIKAQLENWSPKCMSEHPSRVIAHQNLIDQTKYLRTELNRAHNRIADLELVEKRYKDQIELLLETQKAVVKLKYECRDYEQKVKGYEEDINEAKELRKENQRLRKEAEEETQRLRKEAEEEKQRLRKEVEEEKQRLRKNLEEGAKAQEMLLKADAEVIRLRKTVSKRINHNSIKEINALFHFR